ncbi:hypothetical protein [Actinophytocola sp.]|uniref:hypothetical protein n=1 Tax=Actinophytocola sp. TaxID=1872138 RepID=UPI003D6C214E
MRIRRVVFAAAVAAIGLGLSACDSEEDPKAADSTTESTSEAPASSETSESDAGDPAPAGEATAPGTELKFGDPAVLPFEYGDSTGTIGLTVTAVEAGAEADLADFGEDAKGLTPYFIRLSVENVGGTDLAHTSVGVDGVLEDGASTGVVLVGEVAQCANESAPSDFTTAGATYETCVLSASPGSPVTAVEFNQGDGYADDPVTWSE